MPPENNEPQKDEVGLLEILRLLIETEKAKTTSDLLKYARQYGAPEVKSDWLSWKLKMSRSIWPLMSSACICGYLN